jgi:D-serine deaminase-like pyridoxal phosphate-dependent protein
MKEKLNRPFLLINEEVTKANIINMYARAKEHSLDLRPHMKTSQSEVIGEWFRHHGVKKIAVSSLSMAKYFAQFDWKDILVAFPFNINEIDLANSLANNINLSILIDHPDTLSFIKKHIKSKVKVWIEIDTGYGRSGILSDNINRINGILQGIKESKMLNFSGFLTHAGHTYHVEDVEQIRAIHIDAIGKLAKLKKTFQDFNPLISIGDTPSCSTQSDFTDVDEIRPGNFIFYDMMQEFIGSCEIKDIAVAVSCPIVARYRSRLEVVIYGGGVHLSKEYILNGDKKVFGLAVELDKNLKWDAEKPIGVVTSLSQEHGIVFIQEEVFKDLAIGDTIGIIPVHSCMTANLLMGIERKEKDYLII